MQEDGWCTRPLICVDPDDPEGVLTCYNDDKKCTEFWKKEDYDIPDDFEEGFCKSITINP